MTSPSLQIPNYLTFGPTQVEEMDPVEFGSHLRITTVMWYFDTHLFYLKQDKSFKPAFVFIDHQPDLFELYSHFNVRTGTQPSIRVMCINECAWVSLALCEGCSHGRTLELALSWMGRVEEN